MEQAGGQSEALVCGEECLRAIDMDMDGDIVWEDVPTGRRRNNLPCRVDTFGPIPCIRFGGGCCNSDPTSHMWVSRPVDTINTRC